MNEDLAEMAVCGDSPIAIHPVVATTRPCSSIVTAMLLLRKSSPYSTHCANAACAAISAGECSAAANFSNANAWSAATASR